LKFFIIFAVVLILSYGIGRWLTLQNEEGVNQAITHSVCDPTKKHCEVKNENEKYLLKLIGTPSALNPFIVSVDVEGEQPQSIELVFEMTGMDMGFNQYRLVNMKSNWQAKVILPVCSLARSDWVLNVKMKYRNIESVTTFKFSQ